MTELTDTEVLTALEGVLGTLKDVRQSIDARRRQPAPATVHPGGVPLYDELLMRAGGQITEAERLLESALWRLQRLSEKVQS